MNWQSYFKSLLFLAGAIFALVMGSGGRVGGLVALWTALVGGFVLYIATWRRDVFGSAKRKQISLQRKFAGEMALCALLLLGFQRLATFCWDYLYNPTEELEPSPSEIIGFWIRWWPMSFKETLFAGLFLFIVGPVAIGLIVKNKDPVDWHEGWQVAIIPVVLMVGVWIRILWVFLRVGIVEVPTLMSTQFLVLSLFVLTLGVPIVMGFGLGSDNEED